MKGIAKVVFAFIAFFRPAVLHPSLPSTLFILPFVFASAAQSPRNFLRPLSRLGLASYALFFILIWSFTIDILSGGLSMMQIRSQFATTIRFALYVYIAYYIVNVLTSSRKELHGIILRAVAVQCIIAAAMLADQRVKVFFFQGLSGYTGAEKVFREYFVGVRIFGWSEELFYCAPVMMLASIVLFYRSSYIKWISASAFVTVIAALNARISALAMLLYLSKGRGVFTIFLGSFIAFLFISAVYASIETGSRIYEIQDYIFSDLQGGQSRTLMLLLEHVHFPEGFVGWLLGSHEYLYGGGYIVRSDIGFVIVLFFGGILYLLAWLFVIGYIIFFASTSILVRVLLSLVFIGLGVKGLIFSGNAMTLLILIMFFDKQRHWSSPA